MAQPNLTLIGIESYLNPDSSVFDDIVLPDGIEKNLLIDSILMRSGEFEILYPDPDFLKSAINVWSRKYYRTFEKWVNALNIEYDPLYNYDRTEEYTDEHTGSNSGNNKQTNNLTRTNDLTRTDDLTRTGNLTNSQSDTITHSEKAYNDANFVESKKDVSSISGSNGGTVKNTGSVKDTGTVKDTGDISGQFSGQDAWKNTHSARLFGNIGVTTSQQMLQSELDIARWSLYEHISDMFCNEFCIMVY